MIKWEDVSPRHAKKHEVWEIKNAALTVTVVWNHRMLPGQWCFHCFDLGFDTKSLNAKTAAEAKKEALDNVAAAIEKFSRALADFQAAPCP